MVNIIFLWGKKLKKNFFICDRDNIICCEKFIFGVKFLLVFVLILKNCFILCESIE